MPENTELGKTIDAQIRASGPISLSTYMGLCLTHPTLGYYRSGDPLGTEGDFVTAPEISQMFGEFVGLWVAGCWQALGSPEKFELVELGPGRGTLMEDALRVLAKLPGASEAVQLTLVETNETLIGQLRKKLAAFEPRWVGEIDQIDDRQVPLIVVANEFFDALPVKQYQNLNGQWHERAIGLRDGKRGWGLAPTPFPKDSLPAQIRDAEHNAVWEAGLAGMQVMADMATRLVARTGAMLTIDYGYEATQTGETFQAVEKHQFADPLAHPGMADLTAHVDFQALASAASMAGATPHPLKTQGEFLNLMGIEERADALAKSNPDLAQSIGAAKGRLISDGQMGKLFKALCVSSSGITPHPFGLTPPDEAP